jgi:hypothetical protein
MSRRSRLLSLVIGLPCAWATPAAPAQDPPSADQAAAAIQQKGGKVERDDKAEGKPIIIVNFATMPTSDDDLACLKGLDKLQKLTLNNTKITDAGLAHVEGLTSLQKLYLVDTGISDTGLERLKGLTNLQILSLVGTQITDTGLDHLKGLGNLKTLFLAGTKVTDDGVKTLQEAMPMLKIER